MSDQPAGQPPRVAGPDADGENGAGDSANITAMKAGVLSNWRRVEWKAFILDPANWE
jgi:hypothetical protein